MDVGKTSTTGMVQLRNDRTMTVSVPVRFVLKTKEGGTILASLVNTNEITLSTNSGVSDSITLSVREPNIQFYGLPAGSSRWVPIQKPIILHREHEDGSNIVKLEFVTDKVSLEDIRGRQTEIPIEITFAGANPITLLCTIEFIGSGNRTKLQDIKRHNAPVVPSVNLILLLVLAGSVLYWDNEMVGVIGASWAGTIPVTLIGLLLGFFGITSFAKGVSWVNTADSFMSFVTFPELQLGRASLSILSSRLVTVGVVIAMVWFVYEYKRSRYVEIKRQGQLVLVDTTNYILPSGSRILERHLRKYAVKCVADETDEIAESPVLGRVKPVDCGYALDCGEVELTSQHIKGKTFTVRAFVGEDEKEFKNSQKFDASKIEEWKISSSFSGLYSSTSKLEREIKNEVCGKRSQSNDYDLMYTEESKQPFIEVRFHPPENRKNALERYSNIQQILMENIPDDESEIEKTMKAWLPAIVDYEMPQEDGIFPCTIFEKLLSTKLDNIANGSDKNAELAYLELEVLSGVFNKRGDTSKLCPNTKEAIKSYVDALVEPTNVTDSLSRVAGFGLDRTKRAISALYSLREIEGEWAIDDWVSRQAGRLMGSVNNNHVVDLNIYIDQRYGGDPQRF
jgi:hypothetical protein